MPKNLQNREINENKYEALFSKFSLKCFVLLRRAVSFSSQLFSHHMILFSKIHFQKLMNKKKLGPNKNTHFVVMLQYTLHTERGISYFFHTHSHTHTICNVCNIYLIKLHTVHGIYSTKYVQQSELQLVYWGCASKISKRKGNFP